MIFGVQAGKFRNTAGTVEVLLDYDVLSPSWIEPNVIMHQSVINTHREWIKIADHHASFTVMVNLHKYANPWTKLIEIYAHLNTLVYFYPHRDAGALKNDAGTEIKFFIESMEPFCYEEPWYDAVNITFRSQDPYDFNQSLDGLLENKSGDLFQDKSGDNLIIRPGYQYHEDEKTDPGDGDGTTESAS